MLSVRDNTRKSRRQHKRGPERKRVPSRQVSCPLLAQNGHRGLFCLEGIAEDLARFRVHKMDLLTRKTGHRLIGIPIARHRLVRRVALNAKPGIGAVIKDRSHALRMPRRAVTTVIARASTCLWLSELRAKQGMLPLLAHEVRPYLVSDELSEVGRCALSCL